MRNTLLLLAALLLSSCAQNPPPALSQPSLPLPEAVKEAPSASAEGTFTLLLQEHHSDTLNALVQSLQNMHNETQLDLRQSIEKLKGWPLPTAPAAPSR